MRNNFSKTDNKSALIIGLLFCCSLLSAILKLNSIRSFCFYLSIAVTLYFFIKDFFNEKTRVELSFLLLFLTSSVLIEFKFNLEYFKGIIIVFCVFVCFTKITYFSKQTTSLLKKRVGTLFFLLSLTIEIFYYLGGLNKVFYGDTDLTALNMNNPNEAGIWITCTFLVLVCSIDVWENKIIKFGLWGIAALLLPIIWATGSRNSMIVCMIFVVAFAILKFVKINKISKRVVFLAVTLPAIVFVVYMYIFIPYLGVFEESLSGLVSEGKGLTSRSEIWQKVIENFRSCFLLGDYSNFFNAQMHNSLATLFVLFGFPATVLMCMILYKNMVAFCNEKTTVPALALLCVLVTGCFEASLFVGVAGLFLVVLILPIFSKEE